MMHVSSRFRILIGVAVVLAVVVAGRLLLFGGRDEDEGGAAKDPAMAEVVKFSRAKDVAGLGKAAAHGSVEIAWRAVGALGESGRPAVPYIKQAMKDDRPRVRQQAATAYSHAAERKEAEPLAKLATEDPSGDVRAAAVSGLSRMYAFEQMDALLAAMEDRDEAVRRRAAAACRRFACVEVGFRPEDPPDKRRAAVARMRAAWLKDKDRAEKYWILILEKKARGELGPQ